MPRIRYRVEGDKDDKEAKEGNHRKRKGRRED
jgi:hypothetical protein